MRVAGAVVVLVVAAGIAAGAARPATPGIRFTPQGIVKRVRQVVAVFPEAMVALGDPRPVADPFQVECAAPGTGRWIDTRTWTYDFERDLPSGLQCRFRLAAGVQSLAGRPIVDATTYELSTGGPAVRAEEPPDDGTIVEDQVFLLALDGPVDEASVATQAYFAVEGLPERIPLRVLPAADRDAVIRSVTYWDKSAPSIAVQAERRFPNGAKVHLRWEAGIRSPSGVATRDPQVLDFIVRDAFSAEVACDHETSHAGCIPLTPIVVRFTAPVATALAHAMALVAPDGRRWSPEEAATFVPTVRRVRFVPPFPPKSELRIELPSGLVDEEGRALEGAGVLAQPIHTDGYPPLAKFAGRFGIIEAKADPALPVTVRNLEPDAAASIAQIRGVMARIPADDVPAMLGWLRRVGSAQRDRSVFASAKPAPQRTSFTLPQAKENDAFEVIGIPLTQPGLYVVELASTRLGTALLEKPAPLYVPTAALVTDLAVHFKWGRERSLAWVTSLETGKPVAGARVRVADCRGTVHATGTSDAQGLVWTGALPSASDLPACNDPAQESEDAYTDGREIEALSSLAGGLLVVAETDDDVSFVHSSWTRGIEPWRFRLPERGWSGPVAAHTVLDRTLFRAGETVHMKHILRRQTLAGFDAVPAAERPTKVIVRHEGSDERYELGVAWGETGAAETTWDIPPFAKLGAYEIVLATAAPPDEPWRRNEWTSGGFRVEEFRVPLMRGTLRLPTEPPLGGSVVAADVAVQYLAGGPAGNLPVVLRAETRPEPYDTPDRLAGYIFSNGPVREETTRGGDDYDEDGDDRQDAGKPMLLGRREVTLDAAGTARIELPSLPATDVPRRLTTELEFRDPNGEVQTASARTTVWPARVCAGIKARDWAKTRGDLRAQVVVLDLGGRPAGNVPVRVTAFEEKIYSTRKRVIGGFYAYEHVREVRRVGELCRGTTSAGGHFKCEGRPSVEGEIVLQVEATDRDGRTSAANTHVWVGRGDEFWFAADDHDRMDVLAEQRRYEPGETARLQVRTPFRQATALVTLEREGVLDARVVPLDATDPVVEVPIRDSYAPNMFVSVLAVRGRVGDVQPTAMVDLGRPTFKLGIAELCVGWRAHELQVRVEPDREVYRVRDRATVRVAVRTPGGAPPPPGSEVAMAAVDEGLLELSPNRSWNLLDAMMSLRGYSVTTATAAMQVVGKRHFGRKALPSGGGGGRQATRELFDTLLLWRASVPLDADGRATVEIPLNDSLTTFRIVAVATGALGKFGTGAASIRASQDLMLFSGLPPLVRDGDRFRAELTVRNATTRPMTVEVRATAPALAAPLAPQSLPLAAGEGRVVGWDVTVPASDAPLAYTFEAGEAGGPQDRLAVTQQVRPAVPERTLAATLLQLAGSSSVPVARPVDALPDRGGIDVTMSPSLGVGLDGARDWMRRYPYGCLEQRVSRAVALGDARVRDDVLGALPSHLDGAGLLKFFPTTQNGSEVLTAYVLSIARAAGWTLPPSVVDRTTAGLASFVDGRLRPDTTVRGADLVLRKLAAVAALAAWGKAEARSLGGIVVEPNLWPTSAVLDWWAILRALPAIPNRDAHLRDVEQILRGRLDLSGTTLRFSGPGDHELWWLLVSPETNGARLLLLAQSEPAWHDDLPRIVRGLLALQQRGSWSTTTANAWGTVAVEAFAKAFESEPVAGRTTVSLGPETRVYGWDGAPGGGTLHFPWSPADTLALLQAGSGKPWAIVQARAALPLTAPLANGYRVTKTVTPLDHGSGPLRRGDRARVRLDVDAEADMGWVVVNDPVPAGTSHIRTEPPADDPASSFAPPTFAERAFDSFRAYFAYVSKGALRVEYTIRLNQTGRFQLPPTRVEALYAPEVFGELPNAPVEVE